MMSVIQAEFLKYKRTFTRKLILCAPLFFLVLALLVKLVMPDQSMGAWHYLLSVVYNWWPMMFIPVGMALFAALVQVQEKKAGNYRNLRAHNVSPFSIWFAKIIVMAVHSFLATLVLMASALASGLLMADGNIPWSQLFAGGMLIWLVSLPIIPLQLMAAVWKGLFASMGLGIIGFFWGVSAAPNADWMFVPWSWATRLMAPIVGVHPNGVSLQPGDPLLDASVIPIGICISIAAFALFSCLSALWFSRRELR